MHTLRQEYLFTDRISCSSGWPGTAVPPASTPIPRVLGLQAFNATVINACQTSTLPMEGAVSSGPVPNGFLFCFLVLFMLCVDVLSECMFVHHVCDC